jgi:hypothetical protein
MIDGLDRSVRSQQAALRYSERSVELVAHP